MYLCRWPVLRFYAGRVTRRLRLRTPVARTRRCCVLVVPKLLPRSKVLMMRLEGHGHMSLGCDSARILSAADGSRWLGTV